MEYTSELNGIIKYCTIRVTGELHSPQDADKLRHTAIDLHTKHGCVIFLFDVTQAEIHTGTMAAYQIANPQGELANRLRRLKAAILYRKLTDHERFFETVAVNRGFMIKVFDKKDQAIEWCHANAENKSDMEMKLNTTRKIKKYEQRS